MDNTKPSVALVDDHVMLRAGLAGIIRNFRSHDVLFEADNGKQCIQRLESGLIPSIVLLDINMPGMDGYATAQVIRERFPQVKVLALSMYESESSIIRMLRSGGPWVYPQGWRAFGAADGADGGRA